ncbi:ureidoglycolate lyase [Anthocerotibacter panamensis]|uniref:ureidoglycolate lyase n=1 Tax=Anthocerotibacter panamensis TaxID=2857077 RepID=UPI001C401C99|nr:ureidoglycolate lyase [Anthocerotibacter panamensis]
MTVQTAFLSVPVLDATPERVAPYGQLLGQGMLEPELPLPFYKERVREGATVDFVYRGRAAFRTAKILPGYPPVVWLERHVHTTQLFVGLGGEPFILVLAPPNHEANQDLPRLEHLRALRFTPGSALLLHLGTWHDFPIACERAVVILTAISQEVLTALSRMQGEACEIDQGDVCKISVPKRFGCEIHLDVGV